MKKIKKKINFKKITERFNWKKKYKVLLKDYQKEIEVNNKLLKDIDNLELLLDIDFQAQKIQELEALLENFRKTKHDMRDEIIKLREKLKEK